MCFEYQSSSVITWLVNLYNQIQLREHASYSYCARSWCQQTNPSRKNNFPWGSKCYKTIDSYVSCAFIEIWSTWEVWRALKKLEFLSAMPQATLTHLSCSSNFLCASYLYERALMYEPIVNCLEIWGWVVDFWEIRWLAGGTQGRSVIANIV